MEERSVKLAVFGIVVITAIVGVVMLFATAKTGAGVYGGALKGDPFPYTRYLEGQSFIETPGWENTLIEPGYQVYGGATEALVNLEPVSRQVQQGVSYKRNPYTKTRTGLLTCSVLNFPNNAYAPVNVNKQQYDSYIQMGRTCFSRTVDGIPIRDLLGDFACCNRLS